ncbi:hypothetical protein J2S22_000576 [Rhodoplanes tepidamans]|nr:hypothetical protein [Rhodoplanes tepidamans]
MSPAECVSEPGTGSDRGIPGWIPGPTLRVVPE